MIFLTFTPAKVVIYQSIHSPRSPGSKSSRLAEADLGEGRGGGRGTLPPFQNFWICPWLACHSDFIFNSHCRLDLPELFFFPFRWFWNGICRVFPMRLHKNKKASNFVRPQITGKISNFNASYVSHLHTPNFQDL